MMMMALMMSVTSFAQGIKGTVIDENGEAVIGATIADKNDSKNATITDFDGNFVINVKAGQTQTPFPHRANANLSTASPFYIRKTKELKPLHCAREVTPSQR